MAGTSPAGKGGIATVVSVLQQDGFFERNQARYVVSHAAGSGRQKLWLALQAASTVWRTCRRSRAILHVHAACRASFYRKSMLLALARWCGSPTILHLHGAEFRQFATQESGPLARWWIRRTFQQSSVVITLSESWAKFVQEFAPGSRVTVIANSVPVPARQTAAPEAGRILFLGRAEKRKGTFELLQAVHKLHRQFPQIRLVIGGDGDLDLVARTAEQLQISAHVDIVGWIGPEERARQLQRAQIFCLPSHDEGLPMAMLEAMAAGKAIVVTPVGGIPEAVRHGENGLLVPPGDADALAAALQALLQDEALGLRLAQQARQTIEQRFATGVVLGAMSALYRQLEQQDRS